jgi:hypothetical protein
MISMQKLQSLEHLHDLTSYRIPHPALSGSLDVANKLKSNIHFAWMFLFYTVQKGYFNKICIILEICYHPIAFIGISFVCTSEVSVVATLVENREI